MLMHGDTAFWMSLRHVRWCAATTATTTIQVQRLAPVLSPPRPPQPLGAGGAQMFELQRL